MITKYDAAASAPGPKVTSYMTSMPDDVIVRPKRCSIFKYLYIFQTRINISEVIMPRVISHGQINNNSPINININNFPINIKKHNSYKKLNISIV